MTALKTLQSDALTALQTLLTLATTGLRHVYTDPPDQIIMPCLVLGQGPETEIVERRLGQWREVEWDILLTMYRPIEPTLPQAYVKAREIAADVIDRLGTDITLGGKVHNSYWQTPVRITGLRWGGSEEDGGIPCVGFVGTYRLVFKEGRSFA